MAFKGRKEIFETSLEKEFRARFFRVIIGSKKFGFTIALMHSTEMISDHS